MLKDGVAYDDIGALQWKELKASQEAYEKFFPRILYGYPVILEEAEELTEASTYCREYVSDLWESIRNNEEYSPLFEQHLSRLETAALEAAMEAVQLAAMARKMINGIKAGETI